MVVEIHPDDFPEYADQGDLRMLALQEDLERRFYEESGRLLNAPAQRMTDFVAGRMHRRFLTHLTSRGYIRPGWIFCSPLS